MLQKNSQAIYQSSLLLAIPKIVHGYSSREYGDMLGSLQRERFIKVMNVSWDRIVWPQQTHGSSIHEVLSQDMGKKIMVVDGLVAKISDHHNPVLSVHVADCVPLLCIDPKARVIAVAHAGWRGTVAGIGHNVVREMCRLGASVEDIVVSIGPRIGMCCYSVPDERAKQFFHFQDARVATKIDGVWHVDLGIANYLQLIQEGIKKEHIDISCVCTSCQSSDFFSFRRDRKEAFGEIMGILSYV